MEVNIWIFLALNYLICVGAYVAGVNYGFQKAKDEREKLTSKEKKD